MEPNTRDIREIIIPHNSYPLLNENQTLQEAIQTFLSFRDEQRNSPLYTMLFVVNDEKQLVGKLSMLDILQSRCDMPLPAPCFHSA